MLRLCFTSSTFNIVAEISNHFVPLIAALVTTIHNNNEY